MTDDLSKRGAPDNQRINVNEPHEVRYWTAALGISAERLKSLVDEVGPQASAVRAALEQ